ncbi:MAG: NUDIX hydrolase, partial [Candidatus Pacebacteria bacterium CG_4_10_14_0_8_um_filter_43_12]
MLRKWKLLSSKIGYSHPFFKVREDHVITPTGLEINDYTVWESGDVAQV